MDHPLIYWSGVVANYIIDIGAFYLYYKIIIPKNLLEKFSPYKFILISLLVMIVGVFFRIVIWNRMPLLNGEIPFEAIRKQSFPLMYNATFYSSITIFISIVELWVLSEIEKNKLKKLTVDSKINFLKSQINPHFIFNTLNNIYSLSLKSKDKTRVALRKLLSTFSYLKKVENSSTVTIKDTEEYISSYVELSKMRLKYPEKISYVFETLDSGSRIYPMLLMPFIENAFKHSNPVEDHDFILIHLKGKQEGIEVEVRNSMPAHVMNKDSHSGIGLKNVKERLSLLFKKEEYSISTQILNNEYVSSLKMPYAKS